MSVETTTGSSDAIGGIESAVSETVARAEQVLSHRFGATIRLADPEHLGGSGKSTVVRVRVASSPFSLPRTLVVKRYGPAGQQVVGDAFVQEAVSYQLFTAFSPEDRMCPEMFAHDGAVRLVVLEDLGRAPTLENKLLGNDPKAADWLSERIHVPVVILPYSVGGTPAAHDLFALFDDTVARLLGAAK